ncbi:MAG TPA: UDP-N-acetylmuramoyl-L-alanyl-D-glutamate--2,6-diaminopimelate ligase [Coriobacteriia bacterium]|nr:UDP-N-acetylmuramoyl-L-alanyl-D-glutamate--2,6-diaminopimelate ligase [Coriobacteriia bacterium]
MTRTIKQLLGDMATSSVVDDVAVTGVAYRSNKVSDGDAFFCIPGFAHDGHDFAQHAVDRGAVALVVERPLPIDAPQFTVADSRVALAEAAARFYGSPSNRMDVIGVTGTNGKTTTVYLIDSIMREAHRTTGLIGTVETRIADERLGSSRTTPESADLQALLADMAALGVSSCAMEVSSHAIDLHRVDAVRFAAVAFTNLTQDHLDFHHTLEEYFSVKRRLLTEFDVGARIVNVDDPFGIGIAAEISDAVTVGRSSTAQIRALNERPDARGTSFTLASPVGEAEVRLPLAGAYNVSNALVAAGCTLSVGVTLAEVVRGLEHAPQVPGRMERVDCGQPFAVMVDYAHTPDSLEKAILAMKDVTQGRVIVVFGCGGDRDPDKRPMMGMAASAHADHVVLTSDNPRSEDPVGIILQIEDGVREGSATYEVVVDRRGAISTAIARAVPGDAVLIAGKGHEDYQIFVDRTIHFDDREVAREALEC